jgi:hypothetical protein
MTELLRRLPVEEACQQIDEMFYGVPEHAVAPLARQLADLIVQDRETLLNVAKWLASYGQFDEAQTLLWRGVRLYEADTDVWKCAFDISLQCLLYSTPFPEWQRAYMRYQYIAANTPPDIRRHAPIAPYLLFSQEEAKHLSEIAGVCLWFWQAGIIDKAREWMRVWWEELQKQSAVPDVALRVAVWYMLGLGMFAETAADSLVEQRCPDRSLVAKWFNGLPLPHPVQGSGADALLMFIQWSQYLMELRRPPLSLVWRSLLAAHGAAEAFVHSMLLVATYGVRKERHRQTFLPRFERSQVGWFLPYLHLLCIATARLGWEAETRLVWQRIGTFDAGYPRKEELLRFLRRRLPTTELQ